VTVFAGCKKTSYVAKFDKTPQERAADQISLVSTTLTSAPNGWVATLPTLSGGGFGFYMNFDNQQNVTMYADLTDGSASVAGKSYYRVKQDIGTDLVFDSYNFISMLDDPNSAVYGGENKIGYKSDIDFIYQKISGDTIIFLGKKYRQPFKLVKATAAQKATYEAGGYKTAIDKYKSYFTTNRYPYIEITSGNSTIKVEISHNLSNVMGVAKRVDFTGVLADGKTIKSSATKFAYNLNGTDLLNAGLVFEGITFVKFVWKDANTLAVYDSTGKEYIVKNNPTPLVPLYLLWGTKYGGMLSDYKTIYPGTSTAGADILNYFHNGLIPAITGGFAFNYGRINFVWNTVNKRLRIDGFSSQNGGSSGWITTSAYNYTVDANGVYKFTQQSAPAGGYVSGPLSRMYTFILNN
ncbi:MAG: DUF4302 domain-containing protein, partial [Pedobacter sp.]